MNKHVLLVLKWLKNPESVSREEVNEHYDSMDWISVIDGEDLHVCIELAIEGIIMENELTEEFINEYFRLSGENRDDYEKEL